MQILQRYLHIIGFEKKIMLANFENCMIWHREPTYVYYKTLDQSHISKSYGSYAGTCLLL